MTDLKNLFKPKVEFENSNIQISDELRKRAGKPVINHRTIEDVGICLENNIESAMELSEQSRKDALSLFMKD